MSTISYLPPLDPASLLSASRRERDLAYLTGGASVDVLVVGGGITGVGVALDAATRGLSVALVEQDDLANGTSRWSSKLVHGGLRYLAKGSPGVAWESAFERAILAQRVTPTSSDRWPRSYPTSPATAGPPDSHSLASVRAMPCDAPPEHPAACSPTPAMWMPTSRSDSSRACARRGSWAPPSGGTANSSTMRVWWSPWHGPPPHTGHAS